MPTAERTTCELRDTSFAEGMTAAKHQWEFFFVIVMITTYRAHCYTFHCLFLFKLEMENMSIEDLRARERECLKEGNYVEAGEIKEQIEKAVTALSENNSETLDFRQKFEAEELDNAFRLEYETLNKKWTDTADTYKAEKMEKIEQLNERHQEELVSEEAKLRSAVRPAKPSTQYLNMQRQMESLAKKRQYKEAQDLKVQLAQMEEQLKEQGVRNSEKQIQQKLQTVIARQKSEISAAQQKLENGMKEIKSRFAAELEMMLKKYQNMKKELANSQNLERNVLEGKNRTGAGHSSFKIDKSSRTLITAKVSKTGSPESKKSRGSPN